MRRMMQALLALGLPMPTWAAAGGDRTPPGTILHSHGTHQRGRLGTYCWSDPPMVTCGHAPWSFPRAKDVRSGDKARIKIRKGYEPTDSHLHAYRHVNKYDEPRGEGWGIRHRIAESEHEHGTRYFIKFRLPRKEQHLYLDLEMDLRDEEGQRGEVEYRFHLKVKN